MPREGSSFTLERLASKDGSALTYRRLGEGPGLILLHGGLQAAQNLMALASALSDAFTLYVLNRRGRDGSPYPMSYSVQTEREDVEALVRKTGASRVFGLSVGGIIALEAARRLPDWKRLPCTSRRFRFETHVRPNGSRDLITRSMPAILRRPWRRR